MTLAVTYLAPGRFWLLAVVALLAVAYLVLQARRRDYAVRFTNLELLGSVAPRRPGWRRHVPAFILLLGLVSMVIALARPAREERVPRERATVIMALDVSLSMEAEDVSPTRLVAAQEAAKTFLDIVPARINIGLVSFAGTAQVLVTPTTDRLVVSQAIDNLRLDESTAIGEGVFTSLQAIENAPPPADGSDEPVPASIVLMSDGETTVGRPDAQAAQEAERLGVPVSTIAFGTDNGFIELPGEPIPVPVPVNEQALANIADATDGRTFSAASEDELRSVYENIGSSVGFVNEFREIGLWFVGAAFLLLLGSSAFSLLWFQRLP